MASGIIRGIVAALCCWARSYHYLLHCGHMHKMSFQSQLLVDEIRYILGRFKYDSINSHMILLKAISH